MHKHLRCLERVWMEHPIYFVTTCTQGRLPILASEAVHGIIREVWANAEKSYGWLVGRYVIMPDHVHFFCASRSDVASLSTFLGKWKEWTAKYCGRRLGMALPLWQPEFFDHVRRSSESYERKWAYARLNPVRAGLVMRAEDWTFQGEITTCGLSSDMLGSGSCSRPHRGRLARVRFSCKAHRGGSCSRPL